MEEASSISIHEVVMQSSLSPRRSMRRDASLSISGRLLACKSWSSLLRQNLWAFPRPGESCTLLVFLFAVHICAKRSVTEEHNSQGTLVTKQEFYIMYEVGGKERSPAAVFSALNQGDLPERMRHVTQTYEQHEGGEGVSDRFSHDFMTAE